VDADAGEVFIEGEGELHVGEWDGVTERDEFSRALCGHDPGDSGDGEHVAFGDLVMLDEGQGLGSHADGAGGAGDALGRVFGGDVHHPGLAVRVEVGE
jgi:hypothetical protein